MAGPARYSLRLGYRHHHLFNRPDIVGSAGLAWCLDATAEPRVRLGCRADFVGAGRALRAVWLDGAVCRHPDGAFWLAQCYLRGPVADRRWHVAGHPHDAVLAIGGAVGYF